MLLRKEGENVEIGKNESKVEQPGAKIVPSKRSPGEANILVGAVCKKKSGIEPIPTQRCTGHRFLFVQLIILVTIPTFM